MVQTEVFADCRQPRSSMKLPDLSPVTMPRTGSLAPNYVVVHSLRIFFYIVDTHGFVYPSTTSAVSLYKRCGYMTGGQDLQRWHHRQNSRNPPRILKPFSSGREAEGEEAPHSLLCDVP